MPTTHRWIPKAMDARYLAKTTGGLTATAVLDPLPDWSGITSGVDVVVPVSLVDAAGIVGALRHHRVDHPGEEARLTFTTAGSRPGSLAAGIARERHTIGQGTPHPVSS